MVSLYFDVNKLFCKILDHTQWEKYISIIYFVSNYTCFCAFDDSIG